MCCRASQSLEPVQQPPATEEEAQESDCVHESADLRAGETISLSEVLESGRQRRNRRSTRPEQCPSDHVVPEQEGEAQEGHGGAQEGCAVCEPTPGRPASQDLPGERAGPGDPEETTIAKLHGRKVVERPRSP